MWASTFSGAGHHIGGGLRWQGPIPGRSDDVFGVGFNTVRFSEARGAGFTENWEFTTEVFYKVHLTGWMSIQPDLQYIVNPGGRGLDNALVGIVQLAVQF
jgi:porin